MNRRIVYTDAATGNLAVVIPTAAVSFEAVVEDIKNVTRDYLIITESDLPTSRTFREAWHVVGGVVSVDLDAAKAIAHEQRRAERAAALMPLDLQATYDLAGAEPLRQAIRDADAIKQAAIDTCTTIEELEGVCQA